MSAPLLGDRDRDAHIVRRARRQALAWRFRSVLLALLAGLFIKSRWYVFGALFVVLAFAAWHLARMTVRRIGEIQVKLDAMGRR